MELPENLEKLAHPLGKQGQVPNVFLGELQEFNWGLELCILPNGRPGIRLVIMPALLPFIKLSLAFHPAGLEALQGDIQTALNAHEQNESSSET